MGRGFGLYNKFGFSRLKGKDAKRDILPIYLLTGNQLCLAIWKNSKNIDTLNIHFEIQIIILQRAVSYKHISRKKY